LSEKYPEARVAIFAKPLKKGKFAIHWGRLADTEADLVHYSTSTFCAHPNGIFGAKWLRGYGPHDFDDWRTAPLHAGVHQAGDWVSAVELAR
jgi:hypothetical protein